ncbi:hypothetical protein CMV_025858 [Castanea mollissima]|uniref:Uncharacterized protein n=1 Tax=Castanea mollissima TaxID=60419 RepID=A0A8J4VB03_9ROSI|nr:hypothetical protein CMV_025858 [Castanea mollissima]
MSPTTLHITFQLLDLLCLLLLDMLSLLLLINMSHNNFVTLMMRVFLDSLGVSYGLDPTVARRGWVVVVVVVAADVVVSVGAADSDAAAVDDVGAADPDAAAAVDYVGAAVSVVDALGAAVDDVGGAAVDDVGGADSVDVTACPDGSSNWVHGFGGLLDGSRASISFDESNHDGLGI